MPQTIQLSTVPKNILVISLRYLGDVLLTTPLIRTLKIAYPDANIDVLVYTNTAGMLEGNPDIREIITTPPRPAFRDYRYLLKKLLRRYDLSLVTQTGDRRILYGLLSATVCIGLVPRHPEKGWWKRFLLRGWIEYNPLARHTVLEFISLSALLGLPPHYRLVAPRSADFSLQALPHSDQQYVVMHPHPQWTYKQWHQPGWAIVGHHLAALGLKIILSGGPDATEQRYVEQVCKELPADTLNLAGKLSLAKLSEVIKHARLFIGPDTGITHLAAAHGVPVVALFGPSNPVKWGPWPFDYQSAEDPFAVKGSQHVNNIFLIQGQGECVPCFHEGCDRHRQSRSLCLDSLPAEPVIDSVDKALQHG